MESPQLNLELSRGASQTDIFKKVNHVKLAQKVDREAYRTYVDEIREYAQGEGDTEAKEQHYPGWTTEDFQILWAKLKDRDLIEE